MMEQSRQARKFFDLAWLGMGAEGAVDPMLRKVRTDFYYYVNHWASHLRPFFDRPTHWLKNTFQGRPFLLIHSEIYCADLLKTVDKRTKTLLV